MTNNKQHSITPPPELVQQWITEYTETKANCLGTEFIASRAAQWGYQQAQPEKAHYYIAWILFEADGKLRPEAFEVLAACGIIPAARHGKSSNLREQALALLTKNPSRIPNAQEWDTIRRALEQLDD
jgi:hypothetical protein